MKHHARNNPMAPPPKGWKSREMERRGLDRRTGWPIVQAAWRRMSTDERRAAYRDFNQPWPTARKQNPLPGSAAYKTLVGYPFRVRRYHVAGATSWAVTGRDGRQWGVYADRRGATTGAKALNDAINRGVRQPSMEPPARNPKTGKGRKRRKRDSYVLHVLVFDADSWAPKRIKAWLQKWKHHPYAIRREGDHYIAEQWGVQGFAFRTLHGVPIAKHVSAIAGLPIRLLERPAKRRLPTERKAEPEPAYVPHPEYGF